MMAAATLAVASTTAGMSSAQTAPSKPGPRTATLDWAHLETLLALGTTVVAGTELRQFRDIAVEPPVPDTVADIGLRGLPNLETLSFAKPDMIFNSNYYAWADPLLSGIAPTYNYAIYRQGEDPYLMAQKATMSIGDRLGTSNAAAYVAEVNGGLDTLRRQLSAGDGRPVLLINLGDARHYRVFGKDSMFGSVLTRLGLENAWTGATAYSASAPVGIETLASMPDAWIVMIPPHPLDAFMALERGAFWNALPAVRDKRVIVLGSLNPFGALPAAHRFAEEIAKGLTNVWNG
ncbi:iron complex transport system substrate-binding protein [Rhizobium sp. NFR07]|uniref:ABC transporter substrate-binding protein n=1 Tax=Rhizobium sp. NFR07 TaxID=1566262 RepID=UPI0008E95797|nr:ABC transporter substrate-binding protein [Rhizobium sp. NFR07]SFB58347.1 iron complex transport system substrate-binding protein [Rhizobium sp. NFR07]